ncbi:endonuclease [Endozoicomonas montiporae]|uniref:Endonuclease n=2 Tax=Endozoicomonas montiporae TaxID=1027273 RepID=A0A081N354_9GAMM|nr:GIY-YIG nuclease family protein [Endozoicomonas montiporae]AMO58171.1 excinuclease ABC subunit C [Endozoicomonas montiporae CL-33]KEQ12877.1 endonuclease [Endozoicomonas montiporae]
MNWSVYIIIASDHSLYTGITTDICRRWKQHSDGKGGARYFRGRKPTWLAYFEPGHDRSTASRREAEIKKWPKQKKQALLQSDSNQVSQLNGLLPTAT